MTRRRRHLVEIPLADGRVATVAACGSRPPTPRDIAALTSAAEEFARLIDADPELADKQQAALARIRARRTR